MLKIGIVAGEPSGDHLGADLVRAIKKTRPDIELIGIGGKELEAEGCRSLFPMERLSVMGIVEVARRFFELLGIRRKLKQYFITNPPDVFIGIDAPDFNLPLERFLRRNDIKTVHYVSPSVWAWRQGRLKNIAKSVDLMLTLFPFEKQYYDNHNIPALYTGHPLARNLPEQSDRQEAINILGLDPDEKYIAILPGSRNGEIKRITPAFLDACKLCSRERPELKFIAGLLNQESEQLFLHIRDNVVPEVEIKTFINNSHAVMAAASLILVASGTATLEAMLVKRPMVVGYKVNRLTALLIRMMLKIPYVSLPNLLANERIVPEHLQDECNGNNLSYSMLKWLEDAEARKDLMDKFSCIHKQLLQPESSYIAGSIIALANR